MGHIECFKEAQLRWDTLTVLFERGAVKVGH